MKKIQDEKLGMQPPEPQYISSTHLLKIPVDDPHFKSPWELRLYASQLLKEDLGDDAQLTDMKIKHPGIGKKAVAKLLRRTPQAKLYLTTKF